MKLGRTTFYDVADVIRYLEHLEEPEETIRAMLAIVNMYGSVKIHEWRPNDDAWGGHFSLVIDANSGRYMVIIQNVKYY